MCRIFSCYRTDSAVTELLDLSVYGLENSMSDLAVCPAFTRYVDAYHEGDVETLVDLFSETGNVSFGGPSSFSGHEQISVVHERIGTFRFEIERVFKVSESGQLIEGSMFPLRDGQVIQEFSVPFAVIAECTTSNLEQFSSLRFYYDGRRVAEAVEKAELDS